MNRPLNRVPVNHQAPARRVMDGHGALAVHSTFYTIQGEGPHAGRAAVFVRLFGCNIQCPMCDTDYTSRQQRWHPEHFATNIRNKFKANSRPLVVITGGEPFRQYLTPLVGALQALGCQVQIETNGTLPLSPNAHMYSVNWPLVGIVCSPKTGKTNKMLTRFITAYKYVISADDVSKEDGLPLHALDHPANPRLARPRENFPVEKIYVQPMDPDPDGANLQACMDACYRFGYTLSLQQHKIIGVP